MKEINHEILRELASCGFTNTTTSGRMSNIRIQQIVTLLFLAKNLVTSEGVHKNHCEILQKQKERINHHIEYYNKNLLIKGNFE